MDKRATYFVLIVRIFTKRNPVARWLKLIRFGLRIDHHLRNAKARKLWPAILDCCAFAGSTYACQSFYTALINLNWVGGFYNCA